MGLDSITQTANHILGRFQPPLSRVPRLITLVGNKLPWQPVHMNWLGQAHFYIAILALTTGAMVVFRRKGTVFHRWCGRTYLVSMLIVNISALSIYDLWGRFGPFHIAAIISLVSVLMGGFAASRRSPAHDWKITHAYWMSWSYVGLLAAAVSESSTRYLNFDFGWSVGIATTAVVLVGATVINRRLPAMLGLRTRKSLP